MEKWSIVIRACHEFYANRVANIDVIRNTKNDKFNEITHVSMVFYNILTSLTDLDSSNSARECERK